MDILRPLSFCGMVECFIGTHWLFVGSLIKCFVGILRPLSLCGMVECFVGTPGYLLVV